MANLVLNDAYVAFNSTALSTAVQKVSISFTRDVADDTVMGANTKSNFPAMKNWSASITFAQDFDAAQVDSICYALANGASSQARFFVDFRPTSAACSTQNPRYTGYAMIPDYGIMNAGVGEFGQATISLVPAKSSTGGVTTADLTRSTTST
jgi:hypothetical protein